MTNAVLGVKHARRATQPGPRSTNPALAASLYPMGSSIALPRLAILSLLVVSCRVHAASARGSSPFREKPTCVYLFHVICNIVEPVRLMVKPDTPTPPAAVRSYARHPAPALCQTSRRRRGN